MKKLLIRVVLLAIVGAIAWGGYTALKQIPQSRVSQLPTTKVRQSDVIVRTFARGEMRAVRSETLVAPNLFGTVQVTKIAPLGSFAKEKDLIVEFDDSELRWDFGGTGIGVFSAPLVLESYLARLYKVQRIGRVPSAPARYFAISVERRLKHPAAVAICEAARRELFAKRAPARRKRARADRG